MLFRSIRNDSLIPAGDITELDTFEILPFSNFVSIVPNIPPAQFKQLLERAFSGLPAAAGQFAQIAGFRVVVDVTKTAQVLDADGNIVTPGERVQQVTLDNGTMIVDGGTVLPGAPSVNIATIDFLAQGGDGYPFAGAPFMTVGVSYQQALFNLIVDDEAGLGGLISAAQYPEGGEGRITIGP